MTPLLDNVCRVGGVTKLMRLRSEVAKGWGEMMSRHAFKVAR